MPTRNWKALLTQWSQDILASRYTAKLPAEVRASGWLGFPGATEDQIAQAEARLKTTLPPSYREFLKATNGWRMAGSFVGKLWSTEEIEWFTTRHQDWIDAWNVGLGSDPESVPDEEYLIYNTGQTEAFRPEYLQTALEISDYGDGIYLLNPQIVTAEGEWEAWFFADWIPGADRYRSFWDLMQAGHQGFLDLEAHEAKRFHPGDAPETLMAKLPELVEELQQKAQKYEEIAAKRADSIVPEMRSEMGIADGLRFAEMRVREIQAQAHDPQEAHSQLCALADELEQKWQEGTLAAKKAGALGFSLSLLRMFLPGGLGRVQRQIRELSRPEGYRQAMATIRWFLNQPR